MFDRGACGTRRLAKLGCVHGRIGPPRCALPEHLTCINGAAERCALTLEFFLKGAMSCKNFLGRNRKAARLERVK